MASAQQHRGADATPQREEKRTEMTVGMNRDTHNTIAQPTETQQ